MIDAPVHLWSRRRLTGRVLAFLPEQLKKESTMKHEVFHAWVKEVDGTSGSQV
jgi:hypothetical protein